MDLSGLVKIENFLSKIEDTFLKDYTYIKNYKKTNRCDTSLYRCTLTKKLFIIKKYNIKFESIYYNELNILKKLKLKVQNVSTYHNFFTCVNYAFLIINYKEGITLKEYNKTNILSEKDIYIIFYKLQKIIENLHDMNIHHRDITLDNIIINKKNNNFDVSIVDFSISCIYNKSEFKYKTCGKKLYYCPELYFNKKYNFKTDTYNLGLILYYLFSNNHPYYDNQYKLKIKLFSKNIFNDPVWKVVSDDAKNLIMWMLHINYNHRIEVNQIKHFPWIKSNYYFINNKRKIKEIKN